MQQPLVTMADACWDALLTQSQCKPPLFNADARWDVLSGNDQWYSIWILNTS